MSAVEPCLPGTAVVVKSIAQESPERSNVYSKIAGLDEHIGPHASHEFLFGLAITFDQRVRISRARLPRRSGFSPSSSSRCAGIKWNGPNETVRANSLLIRPRFI